jgi:hypothetical protein
VKSLRAFLAVALTAGLLVVAPPSAGAAPAVTSVSPTAATNTGPAQVTIKGTGFVSGSKVDLIEISPGLNPTVERSFAASGGTVSADGTRISGVVVPTTGQAPSFDAGFLGGSADVSWYLRVTNPDSTTSTSPEFTILGEQPTLTSVSPSAVTQGQSTTLTLKGTNFARRAGIGVNNPDGQDPIAFSNASWVGLDTYTVTVQVPSDYPTGARNVRITNTDGKFAVCTGCLTVQDAGNDNPPTVSSIDPTLGTNGDDNDEYAVEITGTDFNDEGAIEAALVGFCPEDEPNCGVKGRVIPVTVATVTQGSLPIDDDTLTGTVNLVMEAPGRYSVRVDNTGTDPGSGTGTLPDAFQLVATPPTISSPTKASPVVLDAGKTTTFPVDGANFAEGDTVTIANTVVTQVVVTSRTRLEVTARAGASATAGRRDLTVRHTDGAQATCDDCVQINAALTPDERYIDALYRLFVERPATSTELNTWKPSVASGDRDSVTQFLATSDEFAGTQIDGLYRSILGRPSDAEGRAYWLDKVRKGTRLDQIAAFFYGGAEYFEAVGSTNRKYVNALYVDILGRTADKGGSDHWTGLLNRGELTRSQVAASFYASIESRLDRVTEQYLLVLGRHPDKAGREYWADQIGKLGDIVLAAFLAASAEYYQRVTGVTP